MFETKWQLNMANEKSLLVLICFVGFIGIVHCELKAQGVITKAKLVLDTSPKVLEKVSQFITSHNPGQIFSQVSKVLVFLGPAAMAVSALLSVVTMFLPKEDSAELKAIKEGFEKLNNRLDALTSHITGLENLVELSGAKTAYATTITSIKGNYEALQEAQKSKSAKSYEFFIKQYDNTFNAASTNLYDAMTGSTGDFGFNIVNLYSVHVKCNPVLISEFCTLGISLINKGLMVEGAYLGYFNYTDRANSQTESWTTKMENLGKQCLSIIEKCESKWTEYAYQQFTDTYRDIGPNNQAFADRLAKDLNKVAPQRDWLVAIYNDASGFGPHTFSSYYELQQKWNEKSHDVTIFSTPKSPKLEGSEYKRFIDLINGQKTIIGNINDCISKSFWLIKSYRYKDNDARTIVNKVREKYNTGVVYAIQSSYQPGVANAGGTLYLSDQRWQCGSAFKLVVYQ